MADLRFQRAGRTVSGLWRAPADPVAVGIVGHGAGNDMRNRFLEGAAAGLTGGGVACMRFNFPFTEEGRRSPDRPPVLIDTWRAALEEARSRAGGLPLAAGGK